MEEGASSGVSIYFLLPRGKSKETCSEDLSDAFDQSQENGLSPIWITTDQTLSKTPSKTDVFVADPFEGVGFEHLTRFKCTIVGPRCLLTCLLKGEPVPDLPYPMFTASMRNLVVTSTGFDKELKSDLQQKVERMGGIYSNAFHDGVTHLVAQMAKSRKYEVAVSKEVPIMTAEWIIKVWEKSQNDNVHATDPQFSRYKCPALLGLTITVSQLGKKDRELIKKSIESHGGTYSGTLDMDSTMLLVLPKPEGDKYKYAKKWKIPCVTSDWVFDSIEKGFAMPTEKYKVENLIGHEKVSTPTKNDMTVAKLQEVSMCSTILHPNDETTSTVKVNETFNITAANANKTTIGKANEDIIFDIERVKRAGCFLEDCRLFLSGFPDNELGKLRLLVQTAGGKCLSQLTPSVSHMVIKSHVNEHFKIMLEHDLKPYKVTQQWIVESMLMGRPVNEEDFSYAGKGYEEPKKSLAEEETQFEDDLMAQYRGQAPPKEQLAQPDEEKDQAGENTEDDTEVVKFLVGKKLYLTGIESEKEVELMDWIVEAGGEVVSMDYSQAVDYLVTGLVFDSEKKKMKAAQTVTYLWLEDCLDAGKTLDYEYYHHPIKFDLNLKPCQGVVIGVSSYSGNERLFITQLAESLGMVAQEMFAKNDNKGAKKSTHLVCNTTDSQKYVAALRWKLPVVNKDWLLSCLAHKTFVSERPFLVGDSDIVTPGKPLPSEVERECVPEEQEDEDEEIILRKTQPNKQDLKTPVNQINKRSTRLTMETPDVDLEKFRPKKFNMDLDISKDTSPSKWAAGSEPSFANTQQPPSGSKRKNSDDFFLRGMATPETPYGAFISGPNPSPATRKYYKRLHDEMGKYALPDEEVQAKRAKIECENASATPKGAPANVSMEFEPGVPTPVREKWKDDLEAKGVVVLEREKRRFSDIMEEKANKMGLSWKIPGRKIKLVSRLSQPIEKSPGPLSGVVVYVTKKLEALQSEIHKMVSGLGGQIRVHYSPNEVTHVIFSGKNNDLTKEFRAARDDGKFVVSPDWVKMCHEERRRVEEVLFPHSYNPKMSLNISIASEKKPRSNASKKSTKSDPAASNEAAEQSTMDLAKIEELASDVPLAEEDSINRRRSSIKMRLSSVEATPDRSKDSTCHIDDPKPVLGEKSQIMWLDPNEELERKRLAEKMQIESQPTFDTMEIPDNLTEQMLENKENSLSHEKNEPDMTSAVFMMSSLGEEAKDKFSSFIKAHGASVSMDQVCDPNATHIIAQKMSRSEKMLGAIASGKWILHVSYLEECLRAKVLLPNIEDFEWGNPENGFLEGLRDQDRELASAAFRWRKVIAKGPSKGAFSGIRAIIHTVDSRKNAFVRLLRLGCGTVLEKARPPYTDAQGASHCLAEPRKLPNQTINYEALAEQGVAVVGPLYINEYLVQNPPPKVDEHIIDEYKPFWKRYDH